MSGLLALLDDIAAIAKLAATQLDDVAAHTAKASSKAAGVVIDDAAVTPKYVTGLPAARELPIVWKIARASYISKLFILLPIALILNAFAPWLLPPLLMLGGAYLCFEGAEKVWHILSGHEDPKAKAQTIDAAHLEEQRVRGAIKTDFILSAEIMAISLAAIEADSLVIEGVTLAAVAILITTVVYGAVALLVKADDIGLRLSQAGSFGAARAFGRLIVRAMPSVLAVISVIGTAAMLWVGGNIIVHGLHNLGWHLPYDAIKTLAGSASSAAGGSGLISWLVTATLDAMIGIVIGGILVLLITPIAGMFSGGDAKESASH